MRRRPALATMLLWRRLCQRKIGKSFWPRCRIWRRCRRCRRPRGSKTCNTGCQQSPHVCKPDCPITTTVCSAVHHPLDFLSYSVLAEARLLPAVCHSWYAPVLQGLSCRWTCLQARRMLCRLR
jgi:hypothetical protein